MSPEVAQLALEALGESEHIAALVVDEQARVVWRSASCERFGEHLAQGGRLDQAIAQGPTNGARTVQLAENWQVEVHNVALQSSSTAPAAASGPTRARLWTLKTAASHDHTARALADCQARLRLLSAHTQGIIFELNERGQHVRVWTSDPELLMTPESEILGRTAVEALGPEQGQRHHDAVMQTVRTGQPARYEYELELPRGKRHFACESVAVPAPDGLGRHAVFWIRDVTAEVRSRNERYETERLAWLGTLAAGVAHEINNPLGYMLLNAEHLQRRLAEMSDGKASLQDLQPVMANAEMLRAGTLRVRSIVRDLLELAKTKAPTTPIDVWEALSTALDATETDRMGRAQLQVHQQPVPEVNAHHGRLVQVFTNLLTNAVEAIPQGEPESHCVSAFLSQRSDGDVEIAIEDTGSGVATESRSRIFDPFYTTKDHGTGLGLAICQRIIKSFGGELLYEPRPTAGSRFVVRLPSTHLER